MFATIIVASFLTASPIAAQIEQQAGQIEVIKIADRIDEERALLCKATAAQNVRAEQHYASVLAADTKEFRQRAHHAPSRALPCVTNSAVAIRANSSSGDY